MSLMTDIADAVVAALNGHAFAAALTAVRTYRPLYDLADLSTLRVTVVPREGTVAPHTRGSWQRTVTLDIGLQQRVADDEAADDLQDLAEAVMIFLRSHDFESLSATPVEVEQTAFLPEHLETLKVMSVILSVTYQIYE